VTKENKGIFPIARVYGKNGKITTYNKGMDDELLYSTRRIAFAIANLMVLPITIVLVVGFDHSDLLFVGVERISSMYFEEDDHEGFRLFYGDKLAFKNTKPEFLAIALKTEIKNFIVKKASFSTAKRRGIENDLIMSIKTENDLYDILNLFKK